MSTNLTQFNASANLPAEIASMFDGNNGVSNFVATTQIAGGSRISIKGNMFRMEIDGQEVGTTRDPIDVVILRSSPSVLRQFWGRPFNPQDTSPPACFSNGELDAGKPNANAMTPQSATCRDCPHNVKGSSTTGTGKACASRAKIAVVMANNIFGSKVFEIDIPPASLWANAEHENTPNARYGFSAFSKFLTTIKRDTRSIVTRIAMDEQSPTPKIWFSPVESVSDVEAAKHILSQSLSTEAQDAVVYNYRKPESKPNQYETPSAPAGFQPVQPVAPAPQPAPVAAPAQPAVATANGFSVAPTGNFGGASPAPAVAPAPAPVSPAPVAVAVAPQPAPAPAVNPAPVASSPAPVASAPAPAPAPAVAPAVDTGALVGMLDDWDENEA